MGRVTDYRMVTEPDQLRNYLAAAVKAPKCGFDFETTDLDPYTNRIVGFSFSIKRGTGIYVPIYHAIGDCMAEADVIKIVVPFFEEADNIIAHNAGFEYKWAHIKWGVKIKFRSCSQTLAHLDDPNRSARRDPRSLKLKLLAKELFGYEDVILYESLIDPKTQNLSYLSSKAVVDYGAQDSDLALQIDDLLYDRVTNEQRQIWRMEMQQIYIAAEMSMRGIKENPEVFIDGGLKLEKELAELQLETFRLMGFDLQIDEKGVIVDKPFELGSSKKVSEHFFGVMGIPPQGRPGKSGQYSISQKEISRLRNQYPVVDSYLNYKEAFTMKNNFIDKLPDYINPVTGFVHGSFNNCGAPTGRYSHSGPNLGQLPKKRD